MSTVLRVRPSYNSFKIIREPSNKKKKPLPIGPSPYRRSRLDSLEHEAQTVPLNAQVSQALADEYGSGDLVKDLVRFHKKHPSPEPGRPPFKQEMESIQDEKRSLVTLRGQLNAAMRLSPGRSVVEGSPLPSMHRRSTANRSPPSERSLLVHKNDSCSSDRKSVV